MADHLILIVDDDADIRLAMMARLRASGYQTAFADNAGEAFDAARAQGPAVILLDLGLPDEDGFSVLDRLKAEPALAEIPVVILSARDVYENEQRALDAGAFAFLQKPVENDALLATLQEAIG